MKVIFKNYKGKTKVIGKSIKKEETCWNKINKYIEINNLKFRYYRTWKVDDKTTVVDFGSHFEFFYIIED